jgi:membrane-bound lytic murein transglycosylase A
LRLRPWRVVSISGDARHRVSADTGLITGYYEPSLRGARRRGGPFQTPLYAVPDDLLTLDLAEAYPQLAGTRVRGKLQGRRVVPYPDRAQLADGRVLAGRELVWVDSSIDAFFLQIQGSGRVKLEDGSTVRLAYADVNGRPYRAIGRYLVDKGEMTVEQATAPALREWLASHPERQQEVFNQNPSVVFFREEALVDANVGPKGALGTALTPGRSIAVDPALVPLGAPMFLSTLHPLSGMPLQRLVMAQDTGGAIRGAPRADLFWGWGPDSAEAAGRMRAQGSLWLLWPAGETPAVASRPAPN